MQPVTKEGLQRLIREAKAEGKDTSELESLLKANPERGGTPTMGEVKRVGDRLIVSTGPARAEDFE